MELQHVKEIILRSDKNMKRSASEGDSSSINNLELDLTGLVESIGKSRQSTCRSIIYCCFLKFMHSEVMISVLNTELSALGLHAGQLHNQQYHGV